MNYKKCDIIVKLLITIGLVFYISIIFFIEKHKLVAQANIIIGTLISVSALIIRIMYWRCPYCGERLPWDRIKKDTYIYKCVICGHDIELY